LEGPTVIGEQLTDADSGAASMTILKASSACKSALTFEAAVRTPEIDLST
jgi:hypothetical protein